VISLSRFLEYVTLSFMNMKRFYSKLFLLIPTFALLSQTLFGQLFSGQNLDKSIKYNCLLRINKNNTVNFIYEKGGTYGDHYGEIKKLNDTLFHISATMTVGQFYELAPYTDTIYISIYRKITHQLGKVKITYSNGSFKEYSNYDKNGIEDGRLMIKVNKNLFNRLKGKNYINLSIERKNSITQEPLVFKIPFGSAAYLAGGEKLEFDVVIKNNYLWSVGSPPLQIGHFKLKREN
jgi:hypothetical protein